MKIVWKILKYILILVFSTPTACAKDLIDVIKNLKVNKEKKKKDSTEDIISLIMDLGVIIPTIYAIVIIILEYITKAQTGIWDSANPLRLVNPPIGGICIYAILIMVIAVGIEFFREKTKRNNVKKAFKAEQDRLMTLLLSSAWLLVVLNLITWIILIGSLVIRFVIVGLIILWFISGNKTNDVTLSGKMQKTNDKLYHGSSRVFSEKEVIEMMEKSPKLNMNKYGWEDLARALDESKYIKDVKVIMAGKLPIYVFPKDKKPKINVHFLKENMVESGGSLFKGAEEHFTAQELKLGNICVVYDGKRLTSKDM